MSRGLHLGARKDLVLIDAFAQSIHIENIVNHLG